MGNYKNWIIDWFTNNSNTEQEDILNNLGNNYFELGWIDSLKFMSFIEDIEDEYDIEFSNDEFQNREFSTINGLVSILEKKK